MRKILKNALMLTSFLLICSYAVFAFAEDDFDDDDFEEREEHEERDRDRFDEAAVPTLDDVQPAVTEQVVQAPMAIVKEMDDFFTVDDKDLDGIDDVFENAR